MPSPTSPAPGASLLLDAAAIDRVLRRIAHEIVEANPDLSRIVLVGIPSRGVQVAHRIAAHLQAIEGREVEQGVIDVSMHRDDLRLRPRLTALEPSHLPAELSDKTLVLVDDVLYSGRTCRAAMDAIASFGRPARIQYAVLVDRGHRELPIRADYVGKNIPTAVGDRVYVRFAAVDEMADGVWVRRGEPESSSNP